MPVTRSVLKSDRPKVVRVRNLLTECRRVANRKVTDTSRNSVPECRMANKLTVARMVTLAGAIAAIGPVAVPAGACARTAAPFNNCDKRCGGYSTTL